MYCKVFINKAAIVFSNANPWGLQPLFLPEKKADILSLTDALRNLNDGVDYFVNDSDGSAFNAFSSAHKKIEAAGGLVLNGSGDLLVIHRLKVWDLPKGKLEKDETPEIGAIREVEEECGLTNIQLGDRLDDTFHTYFLGDSYVLKQTYWFEMRVVGVPELTPQTLENIVEARWANKLEVEKMMNETYPSLKPLFQTYLMRHK